MSEVVRIGAIASLADSTEDEICIELNYFAELDDGRRIVSNKRHGSSSAQMWRRGLGAIYRRYHGPGKPSVEELDASYRVGVTDVEDFVRESGGHPTLAERRENWDSTTGFLRWEATGHGSERRRRRWSALRFALAEHGIELTQRQLDKLPFSVEIADDLRPELAPRPDPNT